MSANGLADRSPIPALPKPAERSRLRKVFGVTQKDLAASIGVSRVTIINWEKGLSEPRGENRNEYASILAAWAQTEGKSK